MTMNKETREMCYWGKDESWFVFDPSAEFSYRLTDSAPPEAVESFNKWLEYRRAHPEE